ncbi:non-homologous end-joining factor 1-like [Condylostylus longicornis]|uniref:non-homologous end-joining factor 1-like n=1 Tax=Condylostylus longicornis TaxID=2530218 RepID=UPI00244DC800|nr:non-homologous end-joining factor 1-like [Condylostylus longicornis]
MWRYLNSHKCFFNFNFETNTFLYTDLNHVYQEKNVTNAFIKNRFEEVNPRIDFDEELVMNTLGDLPSACEIQKENKIIILNLKYNVDSDVLKFYWKLQPSEDNIKEVLIHPILLALNSFILQNDELVNIIRKKDIEIEQYKAEGAILKRRLVATKKFSHSNFNSNYVHVDVDEFLSYAKNNIDSLENSSKHMIKKLEITSPEKESTLESISPDKRGGKSKRKRALEARRQENLAKIKKLGQNLYENE